jgi:PTS system cellobiose-specific IIA component
MTPEQETFCLELIMHAGNGRAEAYAALRAAKQGDFAQAEIHLVEAERELGAAHTAQTRLLAGEAQGVGMAPSLLLVHAQDQLMTAISERTLLSELIELYRRLERA